MLAEVERSAGGRPEKNSFHDGMSLYAQTLRDNYLTQTVAYRWQLEAEIPDEALRSS